MPRDETVQLLKQVLDNLSAIDRLDQHPWVDALFVKAYKSFDKASKVESSGQRLVDALSAIFKDMMPVNPPKRGKRLDTRWGKFGLIAAQYFFPYEIGIQFPASLRDAWGGIDQAILYYRYGEKIKSLSNDEVNQYKLVSDELEVAPISTISDWHVKGIEQLASLIETREEYLKKNQVELSEQSDQVVTPSSSVGIDPHKDKNIRRIKQWRAVGLSIFFVVLIGLVFSGYWGWQVYQQALLVQTDLVQLQELGSGAITIENIRKGDARLLIFRQDLDILRTQTAPVLSVIGPTLAWYPTYGQDIAHAVDLMDFADQLAAALMAGYRSGGPFLEPGVVKYNPQLLTKLLVSAQPDLLQSKQKLEAALSIRAKFREVKFSPRLQSVIDRIDPLLPQLENGLTLGTILPALLGASNEGPKTYMLLVENEDELRPTGGFITSVGSFVIKNGNVFGLEFQEAGDLEDWSLPYPNAPWQLSQYMDSPVLVLRDSNWFTDYPTAVNWIEYLYAYNHKNTVDGVFAINQQALVELLQAIGPVKLDGVEAPVTAEDIIPYMRAAKVPPSPIPVNFYRKAFISQIAEALLQKVLAGDGIDWQKMAVMLSKTLNEHNVLLQFDDPQMAGLIAYYGWDGAVRPGNADYFMVVDTNVGFNKTNAVVDRKISYDVDLTNLAKPASTLVIFTSNHANSTASCVQWGEGQHPIEQAYPINYCYWNYLRVYVPSGTKLESATPHQVPADWMLLGETIPARIDPIDEGLSNINEYGTMMVVPEGQTLDTSFKFTLSPSVVSFDSDTNTETYNLKIQKQPGVISASTTVRIHLPGNVHVVKASQGAQVDGQNVLFETDLRTDTIISVTFSKP